MAERRHLRGGVVGILFIAAGANHFRMPGLYLAIMPRYLPWHLPLVYISGAAEMAGGLGALLPMTRAAAGWGLIALLAAVFPANIYAVQHGMEIDGRAVPTWILWARLPLQAVFVWWVWWACIARSGPRGSAGGSRL